MVIVKDGKAILQSIHTKTVNQAVNSQWRNVVLDDRPPLNNNSEKELAMRERTTLAQLRSGHCRLLGSYMSRFSKDVNLYVFTDCSNTPHDVKKLFNCPAHPTTMTPSDLRSRPVDAIREIGYLEQGELDWDGPDWKANNNKRWEEVITSTDLKHNSRKAWLTIKNLSIDPTTSTHASLVNSTQFAHQLLINGGSTMPGKPKCPVLPTEASGRVTLVYPFSEGEYRKGIAALKSAKAVGISDVLQEQLKNIEKPRTSGYLIGSTNIS